MKRFLVYQLLATTTIRSFETKTLFRREFHLDDAFSDIVAQVVEVLGALNVEPSEQVVAEVGRDTL